MSKKERLTRCFEDQLIAEMKEPTLNYPKKSKKNKEPKPIIFKNDEKMTILVMFLVAFKFERIC